MTMNNTIEILAPCGSLDSVTAAVRQGANAVYIGSLRFSARAYAKNFDEHDLKKAIDYCRLHGVKVHITLNTLVGNDEIPLAVETAKKAYFAGADAFIVQDWGLAAIIKESMPDIALHASTQMSVHTPRGAGVLYENGFDRVVLAREMNRDEIAEVVGSSDIETEVFVQGALCMCVSGQCYLSAMIGGRSGNRGRCAQPCRLPFKVKGGTGYDLSLKDNCILNELSELARIGVTSAKIEGRMKRPEYTAMAAAAARHSADNGSVDKAELDRLRAVFSRSGFTSGYYYGKTGKAMFGIRSKEDVISAEESVLSEIRSMYKDEVQTNKADFFLTVKKDQPSQLIAECKGCKAVVTGEIPQTARNVPLSGEKAVSQLAKTGGTAFCAENIRTDIDEGLALPLSSINSMRREALDILKNQLTAVGERRFNDYSYKKSDLKRRNGEIKYRAHFRHCDVPEIFKSCELIYVPLFSKTEDITKLVQRGFSVGAEVPRVIFGQEKAVSAKIAELADSGIRDIYCGNIGTASLAVNMGMRVHGGFGLNVFNSYSLDFLEKIGLKDTELSFELTSGMINRISGNIKTGIVGYGYLPLMITRNCPNKNGKGCRACNGQSTITDRKGNKFTLMCNRGCTEMLNCTPLVLSDKQDRFTGADFMSLRFTFEKNDRCEEIFKSYLNKSKPDGEYTGGLYFRGVE